MITTSHRILHLHCRNYFKPNYSLTAAVESFLSFVSYTFFLHSYFNKVVVCRKLQNYSVPLSRYFVYECFGEILDIF